jgi:hypothetical protein
MNHKQRTQVIDAAKILSGIFEVSTHDVIFQLSEFFNDSDLDKINILADMQAEKQNE